MGDKGSKVKDIKAARRRGLLGRSEAKTAVAKAGGDRRRRTCVTCGGPFLPPKGKPAQPSCCACCALAWTETPADVLAVLRTVRKGARVVRLTDGAAGTVLGVLSADAAVVEFDGEGKARCRPSEVEPILGLAVRHLGRCPRLAKERGGDAGQGEGTGGGGDSA